MQSKWYFRTRRSSLARHGRARGSKFKPIPRLGAQLLNHVFIQQRLRLTSVLAVCLFCASSPVMATQWDVSLVTAHGSGTPGNIQGVSDKFTFSGRIHAHATLVAAQPVVDATNTFTMKWFNGDRLVHQRSAEHRLSRSPYYLLHAVPGSVLGVGTGRVELHSAAGLVATRQFTVTER